MAPKYSSLCRAQLTFEYLHTNSTTHEFLFGALAELVDNSRDAGATKMNIYTVPNEKYRGKFLLNFLDDGCGMDPVELSQVIQFGRSMKRNSGSNQIGQYGNGLKSGSMRIGKDMILLTKKGNTMSSLFLSRTFHEQEGIEEVIVPMPSWNTSTKEPKVKDEAERERHEVEMDIILKHSPFNTKEEFFEKFNEIDGPTGTLVVVYNLKLLDNGEAELDTKTRPDDILMKDPHADEEYGFEEYISSERTSFRAYTSVLYSEPRMRIFIQQKKVRTKKFINCLYKPISYTYTSNRFRTRSEKEVEKAEHEAKLAEEKAKELSLQAKEAMPRDNVSAKNSRIENASRQMKAEQARIDAEVKRRIADEKKKSLKEPKQLTFTFGFNTEVRKCDGMFIYNCNRLIKMHEKIGPQVEGGVKCAGVVGIVDVPYLVLEPTHNKQDFADAKEYKHLLRSMAEHMLQYWKDSKIEEIGVTSFWDVFGYTGRWKDDPLNDQKYLLKRAMSVPLCVQCDSCLKWRRLQFSRKITRDSFLDDWVCLDNTDSNFKSCSKPEQKMATPFGKLQKEIKSVELKAEQDMKKLKDKLERVEKIANRSRPSRPQAPSASPVEREPLPRVSPTTLDMQARRTARNSTKSAPKAVEKAMEEIRSTPNRRSAQAPQSNSRKVEPRKPTPAAPPPKKTASVSSPRSSQRQEKPRQRVKRLPLEESEEEEEDVKPVISKRRRTQNENLVTASEKVESPVTQTTLTNGVEEHDEEELIDSDYKIGCQVESKINNKWYVGTVIQCRKVSGVTRVKVKFDMHSQDKYDKWFDESDTDLKLLKDEEPPSVDLPNPDMGSPSNNEISSSIASPTSTNCETMQDAEKLQADSELLEGVCSKFRRCLHYFRPPDFSIDKNDILHNLTPHDLKNFALSQFVDDYERNISRLVGTPQRSQARIREEVDRQVGEVRNEITEKDDKIVDVETNLASTKEELRLLRLDVNVMIRKILQGGAEIDPSDSSNQVDTFLGAIVSEIEEG